MTLDPTKEYTAAELWAHIHTLEAQLQGPVPFKTWQEAATKERIVRLKFQQDAYRFALIRAYPHLFNGATPIDAIDAFLRQLQDSNPALLQQLLQTA